MAIISLVNNKGGVGKTVTTVNLAAALANKLPKDKKVLVVDIDPQSNATALLLGDVEPQNTLCDMLIESAPIADCIYPTMFGVDILPNENDMAAYEADLYADTSSSYFLLRKLLREYARSNYAVTLIDCPPSLGLWVIMAMAASDAVIVPVEAGSRFSLDGLASIYKAIEHIRLSQVNNDLVFLKALINKVDLRTTSSKVIIEAMQSRYPNNTFVTTIPTNDSIKQAEMSRTTCLRYDPQSTGSKRYRALADELLDLISKDDFKQLSLIDG
jgi:cellulose biosynthesis protein BcsQ